VYSDELNFDPGFGSFLTSILLELYRKQQALELRAAYSKILLLKPKSLETMPELII
jgi:hypothetical protein